MRAVKKNPGTRIKWATGMRTETTARPREKPKNFTARKALLLGVKRRHLISPDEVFLVSIARIRIGQPSPRVIIFRCFSVLSVSSTSCVGCGEFTITFLLCSQGLPAPGLNRTFFVSRSICRLSRLPPFSPIPYEGTLPDRVRCSALRSRSGQARKVPRSSGHQFSDISDHTPLRTRRNRYRDPRQ